MIFTFADFELDDARFELRREGVAVAVQPKVLRLLLLLVAQRERALGEDELMRALWPNETVSRASIKRAVMGARIALDDRSQRAIRTVRGLGYQFAQPVTTRAPVARASDWVGREGLLAELEGSLRGAMRGEGHTVLLFGAPGLGKTRLVTELAARATGCQIWWGRCMELEGAPPYWPLSQVLRAAAEGHDEAELRGWLGPAWSDLVEAFPQLGAAEQSPAIDTRHARFRLFDGLVCFLQRATRERPALIVLDDLHRADAPTLAFLRFLSGHLARMRVLLLATARTQDHALAELARESNTRSLALTGFTARDVASYLVQQTGEQVPEQVSARLHEQTGGNPLFLEEILRARRTHDGAWRFDGLEVGLRGAIERHLSLLGPARDMIACASVLGREFQPGTLIQLCASPAEQVLGQLEHAVRAQVLRRIEGRYLFHHALIRDALYEGLELLQRARLHARVGALLEASGSAGDELALSAMAEHFRLALPVGDLHKALRYTVLASEQASRRFAHEEAAAQLGKALALLDDAPEMSMRLSLARGQAQLLGGDPVGARGSLLRAVAIARERADLDVLAQAACMLGAGREKGAVDRERVALLREALAKLPADDGRVPVLMAMLAKSLNFANEHVERARLASEALARASEVAPLVRVELLRACHEAFTCPETRVQRARIVESLRQLAREHPDPRVGLAALTTQFEAALEAGELREMERVVDELATLAGHARDPFARWYEHAYRATCAVVAGRFEQAHQQASHALQLGRAVGDELAHHFHCVQVNGMLRMQGKLEQAVAMAREMVRAFPTLAGWRAWHASLLDEQGDRGAARRVLAELLDPQLATLRRDPYLLSALCPVAELCVRVGDDESVRLLHDALAPYADRHGNVSFGGATYGPIALTLARLALRLGMNEDAERHASHALREAERVGAVPMIVLACLALAAARKNTASISRALSLAETIGMHAVVPLCQRLLARRAPAVAAR